MPFEGRARGGSEFRGLAAQLAILDLWLTVLQAMAAGWGLQMPFSGL